MNRRLTILLGVLFSLVVAAALGPLLAPSDPLAISDVVSTRLLPPLSRDTSGHLHILGTDRFGRDLLARTLLAGRVSVTVGLVGSLFATLLGVVLGAASGWLGRTTDRVVMGCCDALLSIPRLILLLLCASLWRPGLVPVVVVLTATGWMSVARLVRSEVLGLKRRPFVDAATSLGASGRRVLFRHVVPNALAPAFVAATLGVGNAIVLESGLAFLGLGVQPPTASWGNMIAGGRDLIVTAPWVALVPGAALVLMVLLSTALGDAVNPIGRQVLSRDRV